MSNIIALGNITKLDQPVDRVLEEAKEQLTGVIILGWTHDGAAYFASTMADGGEVVWLLEKCKKDLLDAAEELENE
jgi:hypothetical protein